MSRGTPETFQEADTFSFTDIGAMVEERIKQGEISCEEFLTAMENLGFLAFRLKGGPPGIKDLALKLYQAHRKTCPLEHE